MLFMILMNQKDYLNFMLPKLGYEYPQFYLVAGHSRGY